MSRAFTHLTFTPAVQKLQQEHGSRTAYARVASGADKQDRFTPQEQEFIAGRDGFYFSTVTADGWPYVQFRGGPPGFVQTTDGTLSWTEREGNRQFLSWGNLESNDRVMLFFMDYAHQRRLKVWGHAFRQGSELRVELQAYDWNCPKYITPRFTSKEVEQLQRRVQELEAQLLG